MMVEGSPVSFKGREIETAFIFAACLSPVRNHENSLVVNKQVSFKKNVEDKKESENHRYEAALKLQKVYKSFRTRRQLADCAVLVEQKWWKLLDFAELKRSSISFFDIEKPETAVSRWARARTRAAKVGKGSSRDEKARKLALQHWLEAIDPRHRYGHNLQFYYLNWLHCDSHQPFFYWLDIGEGKEVNSDRCPRSRLQQQCIKYLGPTERKVYEVVVEHGRFIYKHSLQLLDTRGGPKDAKWIFVLSTSKTLYVGMKNKGTFQHSSFLAGGATLSAGRLVVEDGILKAVWPHSGHYLPTEENFQELMLFLKEHHVDLTNVKKSPTDEEDEFFNHEKQGNMFPHNGSETDLSQYNEETITENKPHADKENSKAGMSRLSRGLRSKITRLEIPKRNESLFVDILLSSKKENQQQEEEGIETSSDDDEYETAEESFLSEKDFIVPKMNLFDEDEDNEYESPVSKEQILTRINSHKSLRSYQLARQLSSTWATGVGPRIGCMRDYPSELRFRVLEHAHLSPRETTISHVSSPKLLAPSKLRKESHFTSTS